MDLYEILDLSWLDSNRVVNKFCEQEFWTRVVNKICEQKLWTQVLNKSCEQLLWTWVNLWMLIVNKSCKQELSCEQMSSNVTSMSDVAPIYVLERLSRSGGWLGEKHSGQLQLQLCLSLATYSYWVLLMVTKRAHWITNSVYWLGYTEMNSSTIWA